MSARGCATPCASTSRRISRSCRLLNVPARAERYRQSMRRTKIVATIGPASREVDTLERMIRAGMDVARLNFSHGTREDHAETAHRVRTAAERVGRQVAILQDLPGPKLRIGALAEGVIELKPGERLAVACGSQEMGNHDCVTLV